MAGVRLLKGFKMAPMNLLSKRRTKRQFWFAICQRAYDFCL